jgi:hypothetical protein
MLIEAGAPLEGVDRRHLCRVLRRRARLQFRHCFAVASLSASCVIAVQGRTPLHLAVAQRAGSCSARHARQRVRC